MRLAFVLVPAQFRFATCASAASVVKAGFARLCVSWL